MARKPFMDSGVKENTHRSSDLFFPAMNSNSLKWEIVKWTFVRKDRGFLLFHYLPYGSFVFVFLFFFSIQYTLGSKWIKLSMVYVQSQWFGCKVTFESLPTLCSCLWDVRSHLNPSGGVSMLFSKATQQSEFNIYCFLSSLADWMLASKLCNQEQTEQRQRRVTVRRAGERWEI